MEESGAFALNSNPLAREACSLLPCANTEEPADVTVLCIRNTKDLKTIMISENLLEKALSKRELTQFGASKEIVFNRLGNI
jgi:hypothetical protein